MTIETPTPSTPIVWTGIVQRAVGTASLTAAPADGVDARCARRWLRENPPQDGERIEFTSRRTGQRFAGTYRNEHNGSVHAAVDICPID